MLGECISGEEWLPVPGWLGRYEVSNMGRVVSEGGRNHGRRLRKLQVHPHSGYVQVSFTLL